MSELCVQVFGPAFRRNARWSHTQPTPEACKIIKRLLMPGLCVQVFGPAFRRNARWSHTQPTPEVGDEGQAWDKVERFYDFWFTFRRSWREFPHPDEEDVEQAESREERRCAAECMV